MNPGNGIETPYGVLLGVIRSTFLLMNPGNGIETP